jgi:serine/threonine protein kinase
VQRHVPLKIREVLAKGMVDAVLAVHNAGFLHLDLKPAQFLIVDGFTATIKLTDFDSARPKGSSDAIDRFTVRCGALSDLAP